MTWKPRAPLTWAVFVLGIGLSSWLWRGHGDAPPLPTVRFAAPPPSYVDRAVSCLAEGQVTPPIAGLSDADLAAATTILASVLYTYEEARWDAFLWTRRKDLAHAAAHRREDAHRILHLLADRGVPREDLRGDWIAALASFWASYFDEPPVHRFLPATTRLQVVRQALDTVGDARASWEASFDRLRIVEPDTYFIEHRLAVPHRRSIEAIGRASGSLTWIDLDIAFETSQARRARLVLRHVWDDLDDEWFLYRAATVHPRVAGGAEPRHLVL